MIVVSKDIECNNPSMQEILKEYIQNSPNKIFVIVILPIRHTIHYYKHDMKETVTKIMRLVCFLVPFTVDNYFIV